MLEQAKSTHAHQTIEQLLLDFTQVRQFSEVLCQPIKPEAYNLQAIAETSPVKWHLAHTSWFFETFILKKYQANYSDFDPRFEYIFNSYYNAVGEQYPRPKRGLLSKPDIKEVYRYRHSITQQITEFVNRSAIEQQQSLVEILSLLRLGINHEQQHQELLLTDLKYNLYQDPSLPPYRQPQKTSSQLDTDISKNQIASLQWVSFDEELVTIGGQPTEQPIEQADFCFDNELPTHKFYRHSLSVANRLTTNGEFLEFIEQGGYDDPQHWLSDGWDCVKSNQWKAPLYWFQENDTWFIYTLEGVRLLALDEPVTHVSYYEADAFAHWSNARLLTEQEWESIAVSQSVSSDASNFVEDDRLHPVACRKHKGLQQMFGDVWEWTSSSYSPYPGFKPAKGAVGEYNGKFMCNQYVLRGGSCVTSRNHIRNTYRNFFYPDARWQFSGIRLARDH